MKEKPAWLEKKLVKPPQLKERVEALRRKNQTIATLNGSFDLLHAGHLFILFEASKQADILIVALNSDRSIRKYKSPNRPIITLDFRLQLIAAIEFVDLVTWFEETDPRNLIELVRPDVHVNGAEYGEQCIEAETVKKVGDRLHLVPRVGGLSTSQVLERVKCAL